ncbi:hypothetical protein DH2020_000222 [Rehmannia glutinosa]|uniref:Uncharacterized protein n=1 Tax=Rehmannia glutinosa TaxID=99300 RepID=A0ABR0XWA2_REHGL
MQNYKRKHSKPQPGIYCKFSHANFTYTVTQNVTLSEIACGIFEGLVKSITLAEENLNLSENDIVRVPLKCACPDEHYSNNGVKYFVTYPFIEGDDTKKLSEKFNVSVEEIWKANNMDPNPTVYPNTTVLVPLTNKPFINFNIPNSDPPTPLFLPTMPVEKKPKTSQFKKLYILGFVTCFSLIVALLVACGLYIKALKKFKSDENHRSSTRRINSLNSCSTPTRSSTNSCLSPDFLVGIKYSIGIYTINELKNATKNFSENNKISSSVYKGLLVDSSEVLIKEMRFEGTRKVIDVHSKINHVNIVKLNGVCYGDDNDDYCSWSYLVFEYPLNGSLRECLSISSGCLNWLRRTQIAFDIATGLHYLHYSVISAFTHLSINSENIFLTSTWRAKITVFGTSEKFVHRMGTEKEYIFAFGVVLLEILSGKEVLDGEVLRESVKFLGGGCFDQLRKFVDPCLKDDYPLAEALCLAVLGGSCIEDDPLHRPSMDDVLKILARMV